MGSLIYESVMRKRKESRGQLQRELDTLKKQVSEWHRSESGYKKVVEKLRENEEKYRNLVEKACDGIAIIQDKLFKYVNPRLAEIAGYTADELIGKTFSDFIHPDELPKVVGRHKRRLAGEEVPSIYESAIIAKDGRKVLVELNVNQNMYLGKPTTFVFVRDITVRNKEEKIQASVYKISEAAHSTGDLQEFYQIIHKIIAELMPAKDNFYISLYDKSTGMLHFPYFVDEEEENPGPQKLGRGLTEYVFRTGRSLLADPEKFAELEKKEEVISIGPPSIDWLGVPLKIGGKTIGVLTVQSYTEGVRYTEEEKNILSFIAEQVAMAIERKEAEDKLKTSLAEKEVLLREIHHRVKNNLQIITSLLNLQSRHIEDEPALDMFQESRNRVRSMALVHEKLYRSNDLAKVDFSEYIQSLGRHLFMSYGINSAVIDLDVRVSDVFLDINTSIPCGLIINELISNSLKHAFYGRKQGKIHVGLGPGKNGKYKLLVKDDGVGLPKGLDVKKTESLGLQLVTMLVEQLQGTLRIENKKGTAIEIIFERLDYHAKH